MQQSDFQSFYFVSICTYIGIRYLILEVVDEIMMHF